jgi:hypothetical protein
LFSFTLHPCEDNIPFTSFGPSRATTFIQVRDVDERILYNGKRLFAVRVQFELPDGLFERWGLVMNGFLGVTSVTRGSGSSFSGLSFRSAFLDVGELWRGNVEELPWLNHQHDTAVIFGDILTGLQFAMARLACVFMVWIPIWKAAAV